MVEEKREWISIRTIMDGILTLDKNIFSTGKVIETFNNRWK